jgi:DNA-binding FrmR family transcriptional regulator
MRSGEMMNNAKQIDEQHDAGQHKKTVLVINRLSRIEGHIRAIKRMLEEERSCPEVLIQLAAVKSAVQKAAQVVLEDHIESCLGQAAITGNSEEEWQLLKDALDKYIG